MFIDEDNASEKKRFAGIGERYFDGDHDIKNSSFLKYYLYTYSVGDKVKVTIIRGTKEETLNIKLTEKAN